jgi:putative membrane protein
METATAPSLRPVFEKNDKLAYRLIGIVSVVVFLVVAALPKMYLGITLPFHPHIFATINAVINSTVTLLLIAGLVLVRQKKYVLHKQVMLTAIVLSGLFLVSYIAHHLFAMETKFGGEGSVRYFYFFILITHIILAAIILPFILYTAYQSLSGQFAKHKKIVRYTFPLWLYVSITGVLVYLFISPYYA